MTHPSPKSKRSIVENASSLSSNSSSQTNLSNSNSNPGSISIFLRLSEAYSNSTSIKTKLIDAYLLFSMLSGLLVFLYGTLTFATPYPSFLGAFFATVGSFVFAMNLRIQSEQEKSSSISSTSSDNYISPERALAQFLICHLFLFFVIVNFIA